MKTDYEQPYQQLDTLGIPVHTEPVAHVRQADIEAALGRAGMSRKDFGDLFGVQTGAIVDGEMVLYPWDVEAVLERMISGRRTGTQLWWD